MIVLFIVLALVAVYPLAGYPLLVALIARLRPQPVRRAAITPTVTILIPAYNEARVIARTIENKLEQDYPAELLQIIVVSDCSEDGTDDIVRQYADRGVQLLRRKVRQGKAAALNEAVTHARGEIVVFSDGNSVFARDAIRRMVENFADPRVGYVTGSLQLVQAEEGAVSGGGAYLRYENWLRRIESSAGSIIGVNGGCDAMRRELYFDVPADQITDFVLPLRVLQRRLRVIYDELVRATEAANDELGSEFRMRVRVALRALRGLWYMRAVLNPFAYPWTAFCILSHKILRYVTFLFLLVALLMSAILAPTMPEFRVLLALQVVFYALAALGTSSRLPAVLQRLTALPSYFFISNVAFAVAFARFLRGESLATWRPRGG